MTVLPRQLVTVLMTPLTVLVLAVAGTVITPDWNPPRLPPQLAYPALPPAPATQPIPSGVPVRAEDTSIAVDGDTLATTIYTPAEPGRYPAVVFVHGGGPGKRDAFAGQAEQLARAGIVSLVYDKRTNGYSVFQRDYAQLAADALVAVRLLRDRPDVDPARVGLWGISEGGWVVAIGASDPAGGVAFAIMVSAAATSPLRQSTWALDTGLRRLGASGGASRAAVRAFGVGGFGYVRHDAEPALRRLNVPVLAIHGTDDRAVPPVESPRLITRYLEESGNRRYTVRFFGGAGHDLRVGGQLAPGYLETMAGWVRGLPGTAGSDPQVAGATPAQEYLSAEAPSIGRIGVLALLAAYLLIAAGYLAAPAYALAGRLRRRTVPSTSAPASASASAPASVSASAPASASALTPAPAPASAPVPVPVSALAPASVSGSASVPASAWPGLRLRRRLRWLIVSGLATVIAINAFLGTIVTLAIAGSKAGWIASTGWIAIQALAVLTAGLFVSTLVFVTSARPWRASTTIERVRLAGVSTATTMVLLLAAYWITG